MVFFFVFHQTFLQLAGFVGLKGFKGCSRCLKSFPTNSDKVFNENLGRREQIKTIENMHTKNLKGKTKAEKKEALSANMVHDTRTTIVSGLL